MELLELVRLAIPITLRRLPRWTLTFGWANRPFLLRLQWGLLREECLERPLAGYIHHEKPQGIRLVGSLPQAVRIRERLAGQAVA